MYVHWVNQGLVKSHAFCLAPIGLVTKDGKQEVKNSTFSIDSASTNRSTSMYYRMNSSGTLRFQLEALACLEDISTEWKQRMHDDFHFSLLYFF